MTGHPAVAHGSGLLFHPSGQLVGDNDTVSRGPAWACFAETGILLHAGLQGAGGALPGCCPALVSEPHLPPAAVMMALSVRALSVSQALCQTFLRHFIPNNPRSDAAVISLDS